MAAALGAAFFLGPRPSLDRSIGIPKIEGDIDAYLRDSEGKVAGLKDGAAKRVVWANPDTKARTGFALVYLHGFSSSAGETYPLSERVARQLGANLFYARLRGHGIEGGELEGVTASDWLEDAAEALAIGHRIGERVVLICGSTGGPLALWLCQHREASVAGLVMMSPNLGLLDRRTEVLTWPWATRAMALAVGKTVTFEVKDERERAVWTTRYTLDSVAEMMALVKRARGRWIERVETPALVLYSPLDKVVDPRAIIAGFERLGSESKRLVEVADPSAPVGHVLAGDLKSPSTTERVAEQIVDFVETL